jgi:fumarate reductase subunit C
MVRELSSVFITAYALVLLWGLGALAQGADAYQAWLRGLASPAALVFHGVTLALVAYHAWTWFKVMPKTLPRLALADRFIVAGGVSAALIVSALLLWIA